jgi:chemotaxis protein MotB
MVIIFVLLVFVLAQGFMQLALNGRDRELDRLGRQVAELANMLSLEHGRTHDLQLNVTALTANLRAAAAARDSDAAQLASLQTEASKFASEKSAWSATQTSLTTQLSDAQLQLQAAAARAQDVQARMQEQARLADAQALATIAKLTSQVSALQALRDDLQSQLKTAAGQTADAQKLAASERAQIALLTQQVEALKTQLQAVAAALDISGKQLKAKDVTIADLGEKLNLALASKVAELQKYRSAFFGRLREVLAGRPGIAVVGDRFVFQSEVLFPAGSADLTPAGADQIRELATTLKSIAHDIPSDLNWVLRVDGHADRQPVHGAFASNWELSADRAITVVKMLIAQGVPPSRLAAAGFGEYQPIDPGQTQAAYAKNRRIELRLTDR